MKVIVHQDRVDTLIDVLLERWRVKPKLYPFNRKDAVIPQEIIPEDLRKDKFVLACFYFYLCVYMRGGIASLQVFSRLIQMWREYPDLFVPAYVWFLKEKDIEPILKKYIGWDLEEATKNWIENSKRLMRTWDGNPLNLLRGLRNYEEAVRRIRHKLSKREQREAGPDGLGFRGFQHKMVSMLIYFYDWENWLPRRFLYPAPADFHNFRLALSSGAMVVSLDEGRVLSTSEKISAPWRGAVMRYLKSHKADPVEVADVLWLFSLVMCGNSPVTVTREEPETKPLFRRAGVVEEWDNAGWLKAKNIRALEQTCLVCPFEDSCGYAIPAKPYYRKGKLVLRKRPPIDPRINRSLVPYPKSSEELIDPKINQLLIEFKVPERVPA